jgi:hypothetical protein
MVNEFLPRKGSVSEQNHLEIKYFRLSYLPTYPYTIFNIFPLLKQNYAIEEIMVGNTDGSKHSVIIGTRKI